MIVMTLKRMARLRRDFGVAVNGRNRKFSAEIHHEEKAVDCKADQHLDGEDNVVIPVFDLACLHQCFTHTASSKKACNACKDLDGDQHAEIGRNQ